MLHVISRVVLLYIKELILLNCLNVLNLLQTYNNYKQQDRSEIIDIFRTGESSHWLEANSKV